MTETTGTYGGNWNVSQEITSSPCIATLAKALVKAQESFKPVTKSGMNRFDNYRYALLEDYISMAQPILVASGLSVITSVVETQTIESRTTEKGKTEHAIRVKIALRLIHESGEWVEATSWGEGQDRADKAIYKAITGARKYGLASLLGLSTTDDPEQDETVGRDEDKAPKVGAGAATSPVSSPSPAPTPEIEQPKNLGVCTSCGKDLNKPPIPHFIALKRKTDPKFSVCPDCHRKQEAEKKKRNG